jgi:hypothetical protein
MTMRHNLIAALAVVAALVMPAAARAHGGHTHKVMGTVTSFTDTLLEVKTTEGAVVVMTVDAATVYRRGKQKVDATVLAVGGRVVVDAAGANAGQRMLAKTVQVPDAAPARARTN